MILICYRIRKSKNIIKIFFFNCNSLKKIWSHLTSLCPFKIDPRFEYTKLVIYIKYFILIDIAQQSQYDKKWNFVYGK